MRFIWKKKKPAALIIIPALFAVLAGVFFFRAPVLIVTDAAFDQLYGSSRSGRRAAALSLGLFRRVVPVRVADSAGPDLVALAAGAFPRRPHAVLFPYRYMEAAGIYKEGKPGVPVLVMGGRAPGPLDGTAYRFIGTDTAVDLYRAGLCAAELAGRDSGVLFISGGTLPEEHRAAFREGLRARGFTADPVYADADYAAGNGIGCAVIAGPARAFLEQGLAVPVILFSWADPALSPETVKVIFDDSPWALAAAVLEAASRQGEEDPLVPSSPRIMEDRMEKKEAGLLKTLVKARRSGDGDGPPPGAGKALPRQGP